MSRYRSATWRPIRDTSRAALRKDLLGLHTIVGGMRSCWSYFDRLDVQVYSHFLVGGVWGSDAGHGVDGDVWQIADTDYRAAANLDGNYRVISVETADNAARPIKPWTDKQCTAIVRIMVEAHRLDGIPLVLVPDSKPGRRGICYHRQGVDPYRVSGGERWSGAYGKDCPTDPRIRQIPALIDRARRLVDGTNDDTERDWLDMATEAQVRSIVREETDKAIRGYYEVAVYGDQRVDTKADTHPENIQRLRQDVAGLRKLIEERLPEPTP